ncbi:MAG: FAD binding domain-containing protein [Nitriliruptorales bacterium]
MIPAAFDYVRADSVDAAVAALSEHGEAAKVLAGGHSLLPLMKLRLAFPEVLVDVGRVADLQGVREDGDQLAIGAATPHHELVTNELVRRHCGILSEVTATVGDPQVRHRGTIGGSLAHGDPASDQPALMLALDAELVAQGPGGRRTIAAADFFRDLMLTALEPDELLVEVRVPKLDGAWGFNYQKFNRVAQAWAIVGACALVRRDNATIGEARVGLTNMGSTPLRAAATESALTGAEVGAIPDAAGQADEGTDPPADLGGQPDYRRNLARVLTRRALEAATR